MKGDLFSLPLHLHGGVFLSESDGRLAPHDLDEPLPIGRAQLAEVAVRAFRHLGQDTVCLDRGGLLRAGQRCALTVRAAPGPKPRHCRHENHSGYGSA